MQYLLVIMILYIFGGKDSGYGAVIICQSGHVCNVDCYGDSCNNLRLISQGGTFITNCVYAEKSDACPDGYVLKNPTPSLVDVDAGIIELDPVDVCEDNKKTVVNCKDEEGCRYGKLASFIRGNVSDSVNNTHVCCSGMGSCRDIGNMTLSRSRDSGDDQVYQGFDVYCDGSSSCRDSNFNPNSGIGDIYIRAAYAGLRTTFELGDDYDIYCSSRRGCQGATISNGANVYCHGYDSCWYANVTGMNTVWMYGWDAGINATISDCDTVYCASYHACDGAWIESIETGIYGTSYQSLYRAAMYDAVVVYCGGAESCAYGDIYKANSIYAVSGNDSLIGSKIHSDLGGYGEVFELIINSSQLIDFYVYCNSGDICKIRCYTIDSCTMMNLFCDGNCVIDCDASSGINCPNINDIGSNGKVIYLPSNAPTYQPTYPTANPTTEPSMNPTQQPTVAPTEIPTIIDDSNSISARDAIRIASQQVDVIERDMYIVLMSLCLFMFCLTIIAWIDSLGCADRHNEQFHLSIMLYV